MRTRTSSTYVYDALHLSIDCRRGWLTNGPCKLAMSALDDLSERQKELRIGDTVLLYARETGGYVFSALSRCAGIPVHVQNYS